MIKEDFVCVHWTNFGWRSTGSISRWYSSLKILDSSREEAVVAKNTARLTDPKLAGYYERLIRQMMALSREYQASLMER